MDREKVQIVPYNPEWPQMYDNEATLIIQALGSNCLAIHHFGSTSVPGLSAKAKIDILAIVKDFYCVDTSNLEKLGFENRGEVIPSGRYFSKNTPQIHLHLFEEGNPLIEHNLMFRDWLRTHDDDRNTYQKIKKDLASKHTDGMSYCNAKTEFINTIIEKAKKHRKNPQNHSVEDVIAQNDKVVVRVTNRGTHKGEFYGMPPTGKEIKFTVTSIVRFVDGKAAEMWAGFDSLVLYQQPGMELKPREGI